VPTALLPSNKGVAVADVMRRTDHWQPARRRRVGSPTIGGPAWLAGPPLAVPGLQRPLPV